MAGTETIVDAPGGRRAPAVRRDPEFWRRVLAPLLVVPAAFVVGIVSLGVLAATPMGDRAAQTLAQVVVSTAILFLAVVVWRSLPAHERRAAIALKHSWGGAIGLGVVIAAGILVASLSLIAVAWRVDPYVHRHLNDLRDQTTSARWQTAVLVVALVALAPLGEELLFRGLFLRALVRRMSFPAAAVVSGLVFAVAHVDQYVPAPLWPRTLSLAATGIVLAWLYRWRGYPASVTAHAAVNAVAAIALIAG